jgi:hypothetical protein
MDPSEMESQEQTSSHAPGSLTYVGLLLVLLSIPVVFFGVYFADGVSVSGVRFGQQSMILSGLSTNLIGLALGLWDSSVFSTREGEGQ